MARKPDDKVTVIVIPAPTVNGPLHIGHLSGPFLAADIAARAARSRGEPVLALAGIDVHPNYVLTKAENLGVDVWEMVGRFRTQILTAFELGRIGYDTFVDPRRPEFERAVTGIIGELIANGTLPMREVTLHRCADCLRTMHHSYVVGTCANCGSGANGLSCEGCGFFTSAATLVDASCARCGGPLESMTATVPLLCLENYRERLRDEWVGADLPSRVRTVVEHYLHEPLPDYPVAYPTNWGIEGDGAMAGLRIDFAAELGLSYFYGPARAVDPQADDLAGWVSAWQGIAGLWHFNGIDNAFYFGVLYPALLAAAGVPRPTTLGATVNELYLLQGRKFSTSRNHALWADDFLAKEDPELVRLYLSWDRPDRYESDFTDEAYRAFCDHVKPLLDGTVPTAGPALPAALADAELTRAEQALRLPGFDSALAVRNTLAALSAGTGRDSPAVAALTGRPPR
ncbi:MAG TPA: class I tRNA ligase family protein [Pseudonocardiaceae bacterium]|jgi:methionyl-tRNA synthetase|nr:class I tRNA ligase family protein [Pseudonocardiaceae bacterium]